MEFDHEAFAERLRDNLMLEYADTCRKTIDQVSQFCESPIEVLFGSALLLGLRMLSVGSQLVEVLPPGDEGLGRAMIVAMPQYPWRNYRIDWAVKDLRTQKFIFVECDGHDFHERTADQAERDRSRDREITLAGITPVRFTGREIFRNPCACATEALRILYGAHQ